MNQEIDVRSIFGMLRRKLVWILLAAGIGMLAAFFISTYLVDPVFSSSAEIYISSDENKTKVTTSDINTYRSMASTYRVVLASKRAGAMLEAALKDDPDFDPDFFGKYQISIEPRDNTEVLVLTVKSADPEMSSVICKKMVLVSQELIGTIFQNGASNFLGGGDPNYIQASPNVSLNMLIGCLVGAFLAAGAFYLLALFDTRIKDEEEFAKKTGIPVLGEIPSTDEISSRKGGYGYYGYAAQSK
ncbi:MAG: hypothetical protein IJU41_05515 [Clostridia bacterium]|nr:hypothetical protein [Clostridia bacterium]